MFQFRLPDPGEGLVEAEIVRWLVAAGDSVKVNDIIVEIETSKSIVELPAPVTGVISELLVAEGDTVEVGAPIVTIDDGSSDAAPSPIAPSAAEAPLPDNGGDVPGPNLVGYGPSAGGSRRRGRRRAGAAAGDDEVTQSVNDVYAQGEPGRRPDDISPGRAVKAEAHGDPLPDPGTAPRGTDIVLAFGSGPTLAKPPVRHLAKLLGVDLDTVSGTGPDGQITRGDVEAAAALQTLAQGRVMSEDEASANGQFGQGNGPGFTGGRFGEDSIGASNYSPRFAAPESGGPSAAPGAGPASGASDPFGDPFGADHSFGGSFRTAAMGGERREPIRGVRKVTAQAMVDSVTTHVHVTEWLQVDVTATMDFVERIKTRREFAGLRVSPLLIHAKAVCLAMEATPVINASWDEEPQEIVYHADVNLGIAAATPRGLMVPNIKGAQRMSLLELTRAVNQLVQVSRDGKLQPADYANGTFTITNVGVFGIDGGTPIINRNESAILCMGAIQRRPWVVDAGLPTERVEPRWVTTLALSFDHRLIDGEQGSRFLHDVAAVLEDPTLALLY